MTRFDRIKAAKAANSEKTSPWILLNRKAPSPKTSRPLIRLPDPSTAASPTAARRGHSTAGIVTMLPPIVPLANQSAELPSDVATLSPPSTSPVLPHAPSMSVASSTQDTINAASTMRGTKRKSSWIGQAASIKRHSASSTPVIPHTALPAASRSVTSDQEQVEPFAYAPATTSSGSLDANRLVLKLAATERGTIVETAELAMSSPFVSDDDETRSEALSLIYPDSTSLPSDSLVCAI